MVLCSSDRLESLLFLPFFGGRNPSKQNLSEGRHEFKSEGKRAEGPGRVSTTISFSILQAGQTKISVYDMLGREVAILINDHLNTGVYTTVFDGKGLSSGVYIYRIESGNFVKSKQMILLK